MKNVDQFPLY